MHVVMLVIAGLILLAILHFGGAVISPSFNGARIFIWLWLVVSIANGLFGHLQAGIPAINEIGAFVPIFGIPAGAAWFLASRKASSLV